MTGIRQAADGAGARLPFCIVHSAALQGGLRLFALRKKAPKTDFADSPSACRADTVMEQPPGQSPERLRQASAPDAALDKYAEI